MTLIDGGRLALVHRPQPDFHLSIPRKEVLSEPESTGRGLQVMQRSEAYPRSES